MLAACWRRKARSELVLSMLGLRRAPRGAECWVVMWGRLPREELYMLLERRLQPVRKVALSIAHLGATWLIHQVLYKIYLSSGIKQKTGKFVA